MTSTRPRTPVLRALTLACMPFTFLLACSAQPNNSGFGGSAGADSSGSATQSNGAGGHGAGTGEGGLNLGAGGGSGGSTSQGVGGGCATASADAKLLPLSMYITIDQSGSMGTPSDPNNFNSPTRFAVVQMAFAQFFSDPAAADLKVAMRFWPYGMCDDNLCDSKFCEPPEVNIGPLSDPKQVMDLTNALNAHGPTNGTPTYTALEGATKWAANYAFQMGKSEKVVVLLVTDGEPTSCNTDINAIANLADVAYQGAGVLTFAIGIDGSNQATMDQIAMAGQTKQAFMIKAGGMAAQDLLKALKAIQGAAVACTFKIPDPPPGEQLDPGKVNVQYTPSGGMPQTIGQVPDFSSCGPKGGWYYDNAKNPTTINLCPVSCTAIQNDNGAKIAVIFGCSTQPA